MFQQYIKSKSYRCAAAHLPQSELAQCIQYFEGNGYSNKIIHSYLCVIIHFTRWMRKRGLNSKEATAVDKTEFIKQRIEEANIDGASINNKTYAAALSHWLRHLANDVEVLSTNSILVAEFDLYLNNVAGLAKTTRIYRCRNAQEFLNWLTLSKAIPINAIELPHLSSFI